MSQLIEAAIESSGLIKIPKAILEELNLEPGNKLYFELSDDGQVSLHKFPVTPTGKPEIIEEDGMLILRGVQVGNASDLVYADREARMNELMRGLPL